MVVNTKTANHLEIRVELTPETSCITHVTQTIINIPHNFD